MKRGKRTGLTSLWARAFGGIEASREWSSRKPLRFGLQWLSSSSAIASCSSSKSKSIPIFHFSLLPLLLLLFSHSRGLFSSSRTYHIAACPTCKKENTKFGRKLKKGFHFSPFEIYHLKFYGLNCKKIYIIGNGMEDKVLWSR